MDVSSFVCPLSDVRWEVAKNAAAFAACTYYTYTARALSSDSLKAWRQCVTGDYLPPLFAV